MTVISAEIGTILAEVEKEIASILAGADGIAKRYTDELASGVGKRLRPKLLVIFASLFGASDKAKVVLCAAACELLHTASLIHDDVIDRAETRRGRLTLNSKFGNEMAVLVGDYLLALLFGKLTELKDFTILEFALKAARELGEGALMEITNRENFALSQNEYMNIVELKTGSLFKLACEIGAYLGGASRETAELAGRYGRIFGKAFQITDDILDLSLEDGDAEKPTFNDLMEGRITLPIIHAISVDQEACIELLRKFKDEDSHKLKEDIRQLLKNAGSFRYCAETAMELLKDSSKLLNATRHAFKEEAFLADLHDLEQSIIERVKPAIG